MRVAIALLALATTACASSRPAGIDNTPQRRSTEVTYSGPGGHPVSVNIETQTTLNIRSDAVAATPQELWRVLPQAYRDLGIELTALDSAGMYIGNAGFNPVNGRVNEQRLSRYLNCGVDPLGMARAEQYNVRMSLMSHVEPAGTHAMLQTAVSGEASQRGVSSLPVVCSSTGALEAALTVAVQKRLLADGA